jgi:hypothetical protein
MPFPKDSALVSAIKSQDFSVALEIPIPGPSDSSNCSLSISLGPVSIPLKTSQPLPPISPPSAKDLEAIGNSDWLDTTGDLET